MLHILYLLFPFSSSSSFNFIDIQKKDQRKKLVIRKELATRQTDRQRLYFVTHMMRCGEIWFLRRKKNESERKFISKLIALMYILDRQLYIYGHRRTILNELWFDKLFGIINRNHHHHSNDDESEVHWRKSIFLVIVQRDKYDFTWLHLMTRVEWKTVYI